MEWLNKLLGTDGELTQKELSDKDVIKKLKQLAPLKHGEEIVGHLEGGYLFVTTDGIVKFRSYEEHSLELERNKFEEPPARKNPDPLGRIF